MRAVIPGSLGQGEAAEPMITHGCVLALAGMGRREGAVDMLEGIRRNVERRGPPPLFFVSVASKRLSQSVSLLFATHLPGDP